MYLKFFIFSVVAIIFSQVPAMGKSVNDAGLLWLVNRENPLPADYVPEDLVTYQGVRLRAPAREAYVEMIAEMKAEEIYDLKLQSAYRAYSYQRAILNEKIKTLKAQGFNQDMAAAMASKSIQLPGASEHQLGLALDVSVDGRLSEEFAETDAGKWIAANCHKFGFVIRYPRYKTEITDIVFEPWHLRYVGLPHAQIMKETGKTLEEYHEFLGESPMYVCWGEEDYFLVKYSSEKLVITERKKRVEERGFVGRSPH